MEISDCHQSQEQLHDAVLRLEQQEGKLIFELDICTFIWQSGLEGHFNLILFLGNRVGRSVCK